MARKPRLEIEGGLYHIITRGVDRQDIFHTPEDHAKFIALLSAQKEKLPFYLYAYCLMSNHVRLLIERRTDDVGRVMHRVLTGYTQYYNRRYRRVGHVLQGRYKSILCQTDRYLAGLVRYIHLNPVKARMVRRPERYPYSSHRAYMGHEPSGIVDVDPVLRHFGARKAAALQHYSTYIAAGMKLGDQEDLYENSGGVLGTEEFVDAMIHHIGEHVPKGTPKREKSVFYPDALVSAVEDATQVDREDFCGPSKAAVVVQAKEALIIAGRRLGSTNKSLADLTSLDTATISRRHDSGIKRLQGDSGMTNLLEKVMKCYKTRAKESSISQA